jgi:hypothetical protein
MDMGSSVLMKQIHERHAPVSSIAEAKISNLNRALTLIDQAIAILDDENYSIAAVYATIACDEIKKLLQSDTEDELHQPIT